jgi:hypothetical protein
MREVRPDENETHFRRSTRRHGLWCAGAALLRNWHRHNPSKSANLRLNKAVIRWMSVVQEPPHSRTIGRRYGEANAVSIDYGRGGGFFGRLRACPGPGAPLEHWRPPRLPEGGRGGWNWFWVGSWNCAKARHQRRRHIWSEYWRNHWQHNWGTSIASVPIRAASTLETHQDSELGNRREGGGYVTVRAAGLPRFRPSMCGELGAVRRASRHKKASIPPGPRTGLRESGRSAAIPTCDNAKRAINTDRFRVDFLF